MRPIPLDDEFIARFRDDPSMQQEGFLFKNSRGEYLIPRDWAKQEYKRFKKSLEAFGIPAINPHELRHTVGTLLYRSGTDIFTIQKLMGHSNIEVTTTIYVHDTFEDIERETKLLY